MVRIIGFSRREGILCARQGAESGKGQSCGVGPLGGSRGERQLESREVRPGAVVVVQVVLPRRELEEMRSAKSSVKRSR